MLKFNNFFFALAILLLCGCAQIIPLDGGPKDLTPPRIDSLKTIPLPGSTNFQGRLITIAFDEYVKLNNPKENIIITPLPDTVPDYVVKNRDFYIKFIKPLDTNTTYSVFIDGAVTDITENNDTLYQFVFSTGDYLDSIDLKGNVKNAFSNTSAENIIVGLYPEADSALFKRKPVYYTKTDENGNYHISYIKPGRYKLYTLNDKNNNFKADQIEEEIGFIDSVLVLSVDTTADLTSFLREDKRQFIKSSEYKAPGKLTLVLNREEFFESITSDRFSSLKIEHTGRKDSVLVWLPKDTANNLSVYVQTATLQDTVSVDRYVKKKDTLPMALEIKNKGILAPGDTMKVFTAFPIKELLKDSIFLLKDTVKSDFSLSYDSLSRAIKIIHKTEPGQKYKIVFSDSTVLGIYDNKNDSTAFVFEQKDSAYYGNLIVSFDSLSFSHAFVELLNQNSEVLSRQDVVDKMVFNQLAPGEYQIRMIVDENNNKKWDTGDYGLKRHPERVIYHDEKIQIKSNWDIEINWVINPVSSDDTEDKETLEEEGEE